MVTLNEAMGRTNVVVLSSNSIPKEEAKSLEFVAQKGGHKPVVSYTPAPVEICLFFIVSMDLVNKGWMQNRF